MVALVTPFTEDQKIDEKGLRKLIEFQIQQGIDVLVPCGTTGESATLSMAEHEKVIDITVKVAQGRVPVVAGTGSNNTQEAIELTKAAKKVGAQGALLISPYYNKPTQQGLYQHFISIAQATDFPFILYNIQSRTAVNVLPETIAKIRKATSHLVGVKEASGNLEQISRLHSLLGEEVAILSGDDALTLPIMAVGGAGVISVLANIAPQDIATLVKTCAEGNFKTARTSHEKMLNLIKALFVETNPAPIKTAMELLGHTASHMRLPMVPLSEASKEILVKALQIYGLIKS